VNSSCRVFFELTKRDLRIFRHGFVSRYIDTVILFTTTLLIFGYLMTQMGLGIDYGPFVLVGGLASFGFFEIVGRCASLIGDLTGDRLISYNLTLPLSSRLILAQIAVSWALTSAIVAVAIFPYAKLLFWTRFDLSNISIWRTLLMLILANLFFGFFGLWIASIINKMERINMIWFRFVNPLFMFGGYFYSWETLYNAKHWLGYLNLINPFIYVMEGMRSAMLGSAGFLPFVMSFGILLLFTLFFGFDGIRRLRKRLDCV